MAFVWVKDINGVDHLVHISAPSSSDQANAKTINNYYGASVGSAIDEPPPVNPIPDRKDELKLGDTIDIEEYIAMQEVEQAPEVEEVEGVDYHMENEPDTDEDEDDADDGDDDSDEDE